MHLSRHSDLDFDHNLESLLNGCPGLELVSCILFSICCGSVYASERRLSLESNRY